MNELTPEEFEQHIESKCVIQFSAPWCGPCKALVPIMGSLSGFFERNSILFGKVNIDSFPDIAAKYNVRAVPTIVCFSDHSEVARVMGMKTEAVLKAFIEESLNV